MDKEPLIYLFIINSDFIKDEWGLLSQPGEDGEIWEGYAGVAYKKNRVQFLYTDSFLNLPLEELYFVLNHEAQHVFKQHVGGLHKELEKQNRRLTNVAQDAIINTELTSIKFLGIQPKMPTDVGGILIPKDYIEQYRGLGKDAFTTPRLFNWYLDKAKSNKKETLKQMKNCKKTDTGEYARVAYDDSIDGEDRYKVLLFPTKEDMIKSAQGQTFEFGEYETVNIDNLTPVAIAGIFGDFNTGIKHDFDIDFEGYIDKSIDGDLSPTDEDDSTIPQRVFVENIMKQAQQMEDNNPALQAARKTAGINEGNSLSGAVQKILKSQVNWKKEFKQGLNVFMSDRGTSKGYKQSYITHLMNPRSRYGMIGKHRLRTTVKKQNFVIVAVDTSGSCFYDDYDKERFFTEIDEIAKEMSFSGTGKVYTLMWDWSVSSSNINEYKVGDWKNYKLKGGGGTNPRSVFNYLTERSEVQGNSLVLKLNDKENLVIEDKKKLPMLLFLTDGYFYQKLNEEHLRIYKQDKESIMFLTRSENSIPKNLKRVIYK